MQQNSVSPFGRHRKNLSQRQLSREEIEWLCNEVIISKKGLRETADFYSISPYNLCILIQKLKRNEFIRTARGRPTIWSPDSEDRLVALVKDSR